ncbi:hypothetical protein [Lysobacter gummosus]|uniref:hypothetical protein n=1 Tax=Lysobacter gummosus TaxID=262324 RepID=UPI00362F2822
MRLMPFAAMLTVAVLAAACSKPPAADPAVAGASANKPADTAAPATDTPPPTRPRPSSPWARSAPIRSARSARCPRSRASANTGASRSRPPAR